jgi:hypothetical protein
LFGLPEAVAVNSNEDGVEQTLSFPAIESITGTCEERHAEVKSVISKR